jgi:hypothetical protein
MTGNAESEADWRVAAIELFGTDDIEQMRVQLAELSMNLGADELRMRRGTLFRALAEHGEIATDLDDG